MAERQYVGARYVPKFFDGFGGMSPEWIRGVSYEALTIVTHLGNSYTSKKPVPADIEITNSEYWALTGNYNAQVEQYRQETANVAERLYDRVIHCSTVNEMIANSDLVAGDYVNTFGYHTPNDGGSASYIVTNIADGYYETLSNGLFAQLQVESVVCPEMFGAYGDGAHEDQAAFQECVNYALANKKKMIAAGEFYFVEGIEIHGTHDGSMVVLGTNVHFDFSGAKFVYNGNEYCFDVTTFEYSYVHFGHVTATNGSCIKIHADSAKSRVQYCKFTAEVLSAVDDCVYIYNGTTGTSKGWNNENQFLNCKFNTGHYGIRMVSTNTNKINGWYFYNNGIEGVDCGYYLDARTADDYTVGFITDININNPRTREIHDESGQRLLVTKGRVVDTVLTMIEPTKPSYFDFLQDDGTTLANHIAEDISINSSTINYVVRQGIMYPISVSGIDRFATMSAEQTDDDILGGQWRSSDSSYALIVEPTNGYPLRTGTSAYLKQHKNYRNGREAFRFSEGGTSFGEWFTREIGLSRAVTAADINAGKTFTLPNFDCSVKLRIFTSNGSNIEEFILKTGSGNTFAHRMYASSEEPKYNVTVNGREVTVQSTTSATSNIYIVASITPIVLN